jgi:hypothetical protein
MITITVLLFVFTIVSAIAYQSASVENRSIDGRFPKEDVILGYSHVPSNRRTWTQVEIRIVAFYAEYYKMSNDELIEKLSNLLGRQKSTVVRKMNRLRGIHTGKAPYSSQDDYDAAIEIRTTPVNEMRNKVLSLFKEIGISPSYLVSSGFFHTQSNAIRTNRLTSNLAVS